MLKYGQFVVDFEEKVKKTIKNYDLFSKRDRILVACSGGKDSTVALYSIKKLGYNVGAITVDLGMGNYSKKNLENLRKFCKDNKIKLTKLFFDKEFGHTLCYLRDVLKNNGVKLKSCSICGVLRRYLLNKGARGLKATKIVTGHNLDDECQVVLMNYFRNTLEKSSRLGPISGIVKDKRFVPRVKPLYFCSEKDIERYSKLKGFPVVYGRCPCSHGAFRNQVRGLLNEYEKRDSKVKENIMGHFLGILPKLKKKHKQDKGIAACERCGEPSSGGVCNSCRVLNMLK